MRSKSLETFGDYPVEWLKLEWATTPGAQHTHAALLHMPLSLLDV